MAMLRVENLSKRFQGLLAVKDVNFEVEEGTITGMIGPNGAGKTTTFNMISGVFMPTEGRIYYRDQDITTLKNYQYSGLGIGRTFQIMKPLQNLTVIENVMSGAFFGRRQAKSYQESQKVALEILELAGIDKYKDYIAKELSTPNKKRLELARALATKPDLLLLDEVMAGLNPTETNDCIELIRTVHKELGVTVFMIEHVMQAVVNLCSKIIVLHHGEKIGEGAPEVVMHDPLIIETYLGKEEEPFEC